MKILKYSEIDRIEWNKFVQSSSTSTWFQTPEAYDFFAAQQELFKPFAFGVMNEGRLRGVCAGYITVEKSAFKQMFTRRALIVGGPSLADDCTDDEVTELMKAVRQKLKGEAIYVESRNFNDYSKWKEAFARAGFDYIPHLNFHVHTNQSWDDIEANIGKHRRKYIRLSFRDGATVEENPTIEQVHAYYDILVNLYRTKVKMPLLPWSFFEQLYHLDSCKYLLVMYNGQVVGGSICVLLKKSPITNDQSPITSAGGVYEWYACGKDGVFKNIYPSSVAKYAGIKYAYDNDYAVFDMMGAGAPGVSYGVRDFKAEFGGELIEQGRFLYEMKPLLYRLGSWSVRMIKKQANNKTKIIN